MEYFLMIGFMTSIALVFWFVNVASALDSIDRSLKELVEQGKKWQLIRSVSKEMIFNFKLYIDKANAFRVDFLSDR